jgi:hypothetical protein
VVTGCRRWVKVITASLFEKIAPFILLARVKMEQVKSHGLHRLKCPG